ncbi:RES family NAD+ phosphorylase [Nitrospirillum sp. BR 11163]|uniref:RES family NAD+ phosphorylase n=1 Tax=Nitrospirillum sp. BR 11163 TaxID=3104323 RepID=UPI002AFE2A47|nr:RES domain-containing protein [Nitrospirillum sp. BR 11163]MEA1673508.1 RES domain-containing protein [Nitrospirillum sp. BR 11163]
MTPLPPVLGGEAGSLVAWRLDQAKHAQTWDSGEGAFQVGGRWNSRGVRAVYCALDPATAILEVAVHKGFRALDLVPHVLTAVIMADPSSIHVVMPNTVPNPDWLVPGIPSAGQQRYGDELLARHKVIVVPSVVSRRSWNLVFAGLAADGYRRRLQERFALDPRPHPPG